LKDCSGLRTEMAPHASMRGAGYSSIELTKNRTVKGEVIDILAVAVLGETVQSIGGIELEVETYP
jgi:hypothetical protein